MSRPLGVLAFDEERDVDGIGVAGRDRVGVDARGQRLERGEVLGLLHGHDVGRPQELADRARRLLHAVGEGHRREDRLGDARGVDVVVEALQIQRRQRVLAGARRRDGRRDRAAGRGDR